MAVNPANPQAAGVASGLTQQKRAQSHRAATEAWRYRLDQETRSALNAFRALAQPGKVSAAAAAEVQAGRQTAQTLPGPETTSRAAAGGHADLLPGSVARSGAAPLPTWQAARAYAAVAAGPSAWTPISRAAAHAAADRGPHHDIAATLQACLAGSGGPWPWRKLHLVLEGNGVRAWLRDSGLAAGSRDVSALLQQLQEALSGLGLRLRGFTLNGKPILLA